MPVVCEASSVSAVFVLLTYYTVALPGGKNIDRKIGPLYFAERSAGTAVTLCFWLKTHLYASYEIDTLCIV